MFKQYCSKNAIILKSVLSLGIISAGVFGINSKVDAATQNVLSESKKEVTKELEQALVKNYLIDTAKAQ